MRAIPELLGQAIAIAGKSADNVTALAMMWEGGGDLLSASAISTNTLPMGIVTTTIQSPLPPDDQGAGDAADVFNEENIEKAIDEIRTAIQKSSGITIKTQP